MTNKHLVCFIDGITDEERFDRVLERFEHEGWQVHLLAGVNEHALLPHQVPIIVDNLFESRKNGLLLAVLSNMPELLALIVRLFPRLFRRSIFYGGEIAEYHVELEPVYRCLLERELDDAEGTPEPVFVSGDAPANILPGWLEPYTKPLEDMPSVEENAPPVRDETVGYFYGGIFYRFEPVSGTSVRIVNFDGGPVPERQTCFNTLVCGQQWVDHETVAILGSMDPSKAYFFSHYEEIVRHFDHLAAQLRETPENARAFLEISLELAADSFNRYGRAFMLSFLLQINPRPYFHERLQNLLLQDNTWSWEERYFYLWQCTRVGFVQPAANSRMTGLAARRLYRLVYQELRNRFEPDYPPVPRQERNSDLVVVITGQFLGLGHAPTKTALDRCYALAKHLGKQVVLLNSREVMTTRGMSPFYQMNMGNVKAELSNVNMLTYKDIRIPYYQPAMEMPDLEAIRAILDFIRQNKPDFVVSIGGMNLTADLCDMLLPVAAVSTVFSGLPLTESRFQVIGRPVTESELQMLHEFGFSRENVIESLFTFEFKPQEHRYTREQLGLPEDRFLVAIVGARLDEEVTDEFINAVLGSHPSVHLVFIGPMTKYEAMKARHTRLEQASTALGFQSDVLAVLEVCDLYANPKRAGGGSSAAEALYKGVPVVTLNFGDVAVAVGPDFVVTTYEEMTAAIRRYVEDGGFYGDMSAKGKERAAQLLSTETAFAEIVHAVRSSPLFA
jgi:Glycosyltransferase